MIALWDEADQWHVLAQVAFEQIKKTRLPVVTTSHVLLECANATVRRPYRPALKNGVTHSRSVRQSSSPRTMTDPTRGSHTIVEKLATPELSTSYHLQ
jgi:predicted nucleic acid-binding protein